MSEPKPKITKNQIISQFQQIINRRKDKYEQLEEEINLIHQRLNFLEASQQKADELVDFLNKPINLDDKNEEEEKPEEHEEKQMKMEMKDKPRKTTSLMSELQIEEKEMKEEKKQEEKEQKEMKEEKKPKLKQKKVEKHVNSQSFDNSQNLKNKDKHYSFCHCGLQFLPDIACSSYS